jgi:hypothetical protein
MYLKFNISLVLNASKKDIAMNSCGCFGKYIIYLFNQAYNSNTTEEFRTYFPIEAF